MFFFFSLCMEGKVEDCMWGGADLDWCKKNAREWCKHVIHTMDCAVDDKVPMLLRMYFMNHETSVLGQSVFLRPTQAVADEYLGRLLCPDRTDSYTSDELQSFRNNISQCTVGKTTMSVSAVGLKNADPIVVKKWEANPSYTAAHTPANLHTFGITVQNTPVPGKYTVHAIENNRQGLNASVMEWQQASLALASTLSDPKLQGTHMQFTFDITTVGWTDAAMQQISDILQRKGLGGCGTVFDCFTGYEKKTYVYTSSSNACSFSASLAVECGNFVARWHTVDWAIIEVSRDFNSNTVNLQFNMIY